MADYSNEQIQLCNDSFVDLKVTDAPMGTEDITKYKISINDFTFEELQLIMNAIAPGNSRNRRRLSRKNLMAQLAAMGEMFGRLPHEIANLNWSDYKFNLECYACLANLREKSKKRIQERIGAKKSWNKT